MKTSRSRAAVAAVAILIVALLLAACGGSSTANSTSSSSSSASGGTSDTAYTKSEASSPPLKKLEAEVKDEFEQATYKDSETGTSIPYNVYLPENYDPKKKYPLVFYIADSSLVGKEVTAPLSQYGALIWASKSQQAKQESIVVVPEYPSIIIDDNDGHTTTKYVEMTDRLVEYLKKKYSVDRERVYGTGQSMGCMTIMYLAAEHPKLFSAELFVSGQWKIGELKGLADEKCLYIAAGGDPKASAGQEEVEQMLEEEGADFGTTTLDGNWSERKLSSTVARLTSDGDQANFATFRSGTLGASASTDSGPPSGTTPPAGAEGSSGPPGSGEFPGPPSSAESSGSSAGTMEAAMSSEHMSSFEPAYKIAALRDWLFEQTGP